MYTAWFIPSIFKGFDWFKGLWYRARWVDDIAVSGWHDLRWHIYHMDPSTGSFLRCCIGGLCGKPEPTRRYLRQHKGEAGKGKDNSSVISDDVMENHMDEWIKEKCQIHITHYYYDIYQVEDIKYVGCSLFYLKIIGI